MHKSSKNKKKQIEASKRGQVDMTEWFRGVITPEGRRQWRQELEAAKTEMGLSFSAGALRFDGVLRRWRVSSEKSADATVSTRSKTG